MTFAAIHARHTLRRFNTVKRTGKPHLYRGTTGHWRIWHPGHGTGMGVEESAFA